MPQKQKDSSFLGDVKQSSISSSMPHRSTMRQLFMGLLALVVVAGLAYGGFRWYKMRNLNQPVDSSVKTTTTNNNGTTATSTEYNPNPGDVQLVKAEVAWQKPQKVNDMGYIHIPEGMYSDQEIKDNHLEIKYYLVGTFTSGPYKGGKLYLVFSPPSGPSTYDDLIRVVVFNKEAYVLERYSTYYLNAEAKNPDKVKVDYSLSIADIDPPKQINSLDGTKTLSLTNAYNGLFDPKGLIKSFDSKELGAVYAEKGGSAPSFIVTRSDTATYGFYTSLPDSTTVVYYLVPSFMSDSQYRGAVAHVVWNDGNENTDEYSFQAGSGCGSINYADVVTDVSSDKGLVVAGKTKNGDPIYEYSDPNSSVLKSVYNDQYKVGREEKDLVSYDTFIKTHPIFIWRDVFGRYIRFSNSKFMALAECGKPVIYLYPPQTQKVKVTFGDGVTLTYSEPQYNNGWQVTAEPSGTLTTQDGKVYPYLFWEGRGLIYEAPKQGFMVKREDLDSFFDDKLTKIGLIEKEITDFKEYWLPLMQEKPYYFVGFHTQNYLNKLIPENVTPKPDTVIRVLMDFTGLDKPITVSEPKLSAPLRQGFTLVEWGGVRQ